MSEPGVALVLAGAVTQGAFAVGALSYLAEKKEGPVRRIVATSSGALSAAVIAAGVATGRLREATAVAKDLWLDHGAWQDVVHLSPGDLLHVRGASDTSKLVALVLQGLRQVVEGASDGARQQVKLTIVTTRLTGDRDPAEPLPTYEEPAVFETADLVDPERWAEIAAAAAASATFPGVFAPTMFRGAPHVDGGAVNNAPISYVLDDPSVARVIVITSESSTLDDTKQFGGIRLFGRVTEIAINERIAHDLAVAKKTNARLARVREALAGSGATPDTTAAVLHALGWRDLQLVVVYPDRPLPGTSFSGFFDRAVRGQYVDAGVRAARAALG